MGRPVRVANSRLVALLACSLCCFWGLASADAGAQPPWQPSQGALEDEPTFDYQIGGAAPPCWEEVELVAAPAKAKESLAWWTYVNAWNGALECEFQYLYGRSIAERLFAQDDETVVLREDVEQANVQLAKVESRLEDTVAELGKLIKASCGNPCAVSIDKAVPIEDSAAAEYNGELVSAVDASGEASKGGLYFIAGILVMLFVAAALWKTTIRGT